MGTSGTKSCEGCLYTQLKRPPQQLALKLSLKSVSKVLSPRLQNFISSRIFEVKA